MGVLKSVLFLNLNSVLGKLIRLPLKLIPQSTVVRVPFGPLRGKRWIVGSLNHGAWLGTYERYETKKFTKEVRTLSNNAVIYDLGAHVGYYSLIAASINSKLNIHAFEPSKINNHFLTKHIKLNSISCISLHECAVGNENKEVNFDLGYSSTTGHITTAIGTTAIRLKQISIDEEVAQKRLPPPSLIKMDIEGAEYEALLGMKKTISQFKPKIFLSTHSTELHYNCSQLLDSLGYQIERLDINGNPQVFAFPIFE